MLFEGGMFPASGFFHEQKASGEHATQEEDSTKET